MDLIGGEACRGYVAGGTALEHRAALRELRDQRGILDRSDPVRDPRDGQREGPAHGLRARVLARVDAAAEPGICGDFVGPRERTRREVRLVAGELEADHVGVPVGRQPPRERLRVVDPVVAHGRGEDPRLDPVVAPGVVDPGRDAPEVLLVAEPDRIRVAGGGDQLDVHAALGRARREVLVRDVAVVLRGADHARRHVVGGEEVQEIRPAERVVVREQTIGERDPVALGEPADERGRRRALEVDVQLRLGDHEILPATAGVGSPAPSPTRTAARSAASAAAKPASSRACTTASGWSGPTCAPTGAISASPTAGSMRSDSVARLPPSPVITSPTARQSMPATTPARSGATARTTGAASRCSAGRSRRSPGPPSSATMRAKRSAAAPESRAWRAAVRAASSSAASPPWTSSEAASASVTSCRRGSRAAPVRYSTDSSTSSALPALEPSTWSMSVSSATVGRPAPPATSTSARASSSAAARSAMKAPEPNLTSITSASSPAASFLDRIEATIRGIDSTVPVASRIAYSRRSAGARSPVCPTIAQPAAPTTRRSSSTDGVVS